MGPLAIALRERYGAVTRGSDKTTTGHAAENVHGADFVIRTAAAHDDNPEVAEARRLGIPVLERAEVWGMIMRRFPNTICIAGTHGKSTTTAMTAQVFLEAGLDPGVMVGAAFPLIGGNHRLGNSSYFIAEADEYLNQFRFFKPTLALILNMEFDHPDFYADFHAYENTFGRFAASADCVIDSFDVHALDGVTLKVPGEHNRKNAAAAFAAAKHYGIADDVARRALANFSGIARRFEYKGELNGAAFYDDYAHHPSELAAALSTAAALPHRRVIAAFQPHTYTRTKALLGDFATALRLADVALIPDIYAAREDDVYGVSSRDLISLVPGAEYTATLTETSKRLRELAQPGDIVLSIGAGDVTTLWCAVTNAVPA
jgi:UDP-N-acetylmuramate--alanine ligase